MKFLQFDIKNYKGIKKAELKLNPQGESKIFTLVGLNESGKTTILEAINSFSPDKDTESLFSNDDVFKKVEPKDLVPKHLKDNFNGDVTIKALLAFDDNDLNELKDYLNNEHGLILDEVSFKKEFCITKYFSFEQSEFTKTGSTWDIILNVKSKRSKKYSRLHDSNKTIWLDVVNFIRNKIPRICYFPTFLFEFPEKVYLANPPDHLNLKNSYYRQIIQDILDSTDRSLYIQEHIVDRINHVEEGESWSFFSYQRSDRSEQVNAVMEQLGRQISKVVFTRWNEIFGEDSAKDIQIKCNVDNESNNPPIYISFHIKDGVSTYSLTERSLGFRWFFCFLLFTQFRNTRSSSGTLFLLDEPASNLHATAQSQLLKSFESIADGGNSLIYSTHSHYMVNPQWLENCYIIQNSSIHYENALSSMNDLSLDEPNVIVSSYKKFVGQNPDKATYYQPILDAINYKPSVFSHKKNTVMLEGKGDFYIFTYFKDIIFGKFKKIILLPSSGANELGPLISLYLGWGYDFLVLLDDDSAGRKARDKYLNEWFLHKSICNTLGGLSEKFQNKKLEHLISKDGINLISNAIEESKPNKKQITRFFQDKLAAKKFFQFDEETLNNFELVFNSLQEKLKSISQ